MAYKITSRFAPSIVKAALALEAAACYFERRNCCDYGEDAKWLDADAGIERNMQNWRRARNGYHAPGANADVLVAQCMSEIMADRKRKAQEAKKRREAAMLAREEALMLI